jgi:SnoaL-like polyketide cyclase
MPYSGTQRAAIAGVPASGRACTVDEIVIFRLADGKIAAAWEVYDEPECGANSTRHPPPDHSRSSSACRAGDVL